MPHRTPKDRSDLIPFAGATELHIEIARTLDLINIWNTALCGQFQIHDVLMVFAGQFSARSVVLYRYENDRMLTVSAAYPTVGKAKPETSSGGMLQYVQDHHAAEMLPGAIFQSSDLRREPTFEKSQLRLEWDPRLEIMENSLILLDNAEGRIDALELAFDTPPNTTPEVPTTLTAVAMANAWENRIPGVISRSIRDYSRARSVPADLGRADILGPRNSAGLSRAEQRVCRLLASGDSAREISEMLNVSVATIRTHLRSIYSKTGANGRVRLIALINDGRGMLE
ncbi:helix-turn-helix transcriptional regulator [Roseovarius arcticus]|uniref:helix-turn-helix transcriptional regulator n=1 Tax=Roseovarius arcticus TaxID=2547404 RepID=UPI001110636E|nr:helix-turn-helix transcriptional regulator [Roseovarius arcticus]